MPLYFVTGISGSGKSTVCEYLKLPDYEAYATDEDGLASWFDNVTGEEYVQRTTSAERTPEFGQRYSWKMPRTRAAQLAADAVDRSIFLCGAVANEIEVWDLFAAVIALDIDTETLHKRLAASTDRRAARMITETAPTVAADRKTTLNDYAARSFGDQPRALSWRSSKSMLQSIIVR